MFYKIQKRKPYSVKLNEEEIGVILEVAKLLDIKPSTFMRQASIINAYKILKNGK